jgi:hypothetical protein
MNPKYFGLNEAIGRLVKVPADQGRIVAIAVALAASSQAHLPSSALSNVAAFYGEQVHQFVSEKISEVGESVIFASKLALDYAQLFWKMRYSAAFPTRVLVDNAYQIDRLISVRASSSMDITSLWSGGLMDLSEEMSQFMNRYRAEIMGVASRVALILQPEETATGDDVAANGG